jgi:hypothetical protein
VLHTGDDAAAYDLLTEFQRGYPLANLRCLLQSDDNRVVKAGAWILSEMGNQAASLIDDMAPLLTHEDPQVRGYALDSVLLGASSRDGRVVSTAVGLVDDPDPAVRWAALWFLTRSQAEQLEAALSETSDCGLSECVRWLRDSLSMPQTCDRALAALSEIDWRTRAFGAAAAARLAQAGDDRAIRAAAESEDLEIAQFAGDVLTMLKRSRSRQR